VWFRVLDLGFINDYLYDTIHWPRSFDRWVLPICASLVLADQVWFGVLDLGFILTICMLLYMVAALVRYMGVADLCESCFGGSGVV